MASSRQQKFRNKLLEPENVDLLIDYKERSAGYKKTYRKKNLENADTANEYRKRQAELLKKWRAKKANAAQVNAESTYNSKRALGKGAKKVEKSLPKDPDKGREVNVVNNKFRVNIESDTLIPATSSSLKPRKNVVGTSETVRKFYESAIISRQLPGRKDYIVDKDETGKKRKIQMSLMLMSVAEAHKIFTSSFPNQPISTSKFSTLRPNLVTMSNAPHNTCCCTYCENIRFNFESLKKFTSEVTNVKDLLQKSVCSSDSYSCAAGSGLECNNVESKVKTLFTSGFDNDIVKMSQWEKKDGFVQKVPQALQFRDAVQQLTSKLKLHKLHNYLVNVQYCEKKETIET